MAQMKSSSLAVFNSNDIYPIGADSTMPFEQARDILYLSGVDQEESILVLFPECPNPDHKEILFLKSKLSLLVLYKESFFFERIVSFCSNGIVVFTLDFMSCPKLIFIRKKLQNKSKCDRFVCNAISAIFV